MLFNMNRTLDAMRDAAMAVLTEEGPAVGQCVRNALEQEKTALKRIAEYRLQGRIDDDDLREQLQGEKAALEAALRACNVQAKVAVEQAANAALDVLEAAVKSALAVA